MNYIVLDLEWNQGNAEVEAELPDMPFEIVEIGAIKLNEEKKMIGQYSQLIKPQVYHELHHITRKLIHLQMQELEKGKAFPQAAQEFQDWCGSDCLFCTWGPLDLTELQKNRQHYGMEPMTDGPLKYYDVQKLFSLAFEDHKSRRTLEYAVDFLKIEKDIPFHRAFSDAYYTAKVLAAIRNEAVLTHYSFDTFVKPVDRDSEIHVVFDTYAKYISREFADKTEAMQDREVTGCRCYLCHKNIRRKVRWFSVNGKHYYAVSVCDKHGYMKGKIRIRKGDADRVYVVKTERFITAEEAAQIKGMLDKARHQKKEKKRIQRLQKSQAMQKKGLLQNLFEG